MSYLKIEDLTFNYEKIKVLKDFSLSLEENEFHSLLGKSGCGKSTILHLIAGFLTPMSGNIFVNNTSMEGIPSENREIGIVFQENCLFPHMNVEENIKYAMKGDEIDKYLSMIKLEDKRKKYPNELSGGEQQRVAIARTLATNPKLLLLDEPFSSLDQELREELRSEIKEISTKMKLTTLLVTHSIEEAAELSDRITLMNCDGSYKTDHYKNIPEVFEYLKEKRSKIDSFIK
ncbi:MAG: ABC-type Fe3+/spermidine/putrescine transport system ATPase subunit [Bacteriovoracaceae bacterium]|jgi:ABC-type Fe3+/spermidine/putrescine transport system ATPase subunit